MGVSETGGTGFCIGNNDESKTGIFFVDADSMAHVNFMGTVAVDMGSGLSKALHAECEPPEAIQMIRGYTDQIAWLWTCLPERARTHAPFSRCALPCCLLGQGYPGKAASGLPRICWQLLAVPAHPSESGRWSISICPFFMHETLFLLPYIQPLRTRMIERMTQTIAVPPQMMPKPCGTFASGIQLRSTFMP